MADNGLLFAKLLEGLSSGAVEGIKYKNTREDEERKRKAEEEMKKILLDRQNSQDDFTRRNTLFDNTLALANAKRGTTGLNPDGTVAYQSAPLDPNVSDMLDKMLKGEAPTTGQNGIMPTATAGVQSPSTGIIPQEPQPKPSPAFIGDQPSTFTGKVVNAKPKPLNITESEFVANKEKYRDKDISKIISDKDSNASAFGNRVLPTETVDKLADFNVIDSQMQRVRDNFDESFVGLAKPLFGKGKQYLQNSATEKGAKFYQNLDSIRNQIIYLRSGKQINEQEYKRLMKEFPDEYKSVTDFNAKLDNFQEVFQDIYKQRVEAYGKAGYNVGKFEPTLGKPSKPKTITQNARLEFNSEDEVPDNLPAGTVIYIGGRKAVIN
jgi:hypothetical protein